MKIISLYISILLVCCTIRLSSQSIQQKTDSIQLLIENASEDTIKSKHYVTLGALYVYNDPNKAVKLLHEALVFAKKINFEKSLAYSYRYLFNAHDILGSHSDSLMTYIELLDQLQKKMGKVEYEVRVHWNKAIYYRNFSKNDQVIEEYLKALELVREHHFPKSEEARLLGNIGTTFDINGDYEDALKYYRQAAPLFGEDKMGTAITYFNMATIYENQFNQGDTALYLLEKANLIAEEYENHSFIADILIRKAAIYDVKKQYERASQLYEKALQVSKNHNLGESVLLIYAAYSEHFFKINQYQKAITYSNKAIELSEEKGDSRILKSLYELQDKAYSEIGDYKNAYKAKSKLMVHLDSLRSTELQGKIKELQTEYEVEQKEAENKLLKTNLQSRQYLSIALLIALIFAIALGVLAYQSSQQRKQNNEILEQKVAERTKELEQANYELRTFNYIASHDIKEPIRNIGGHAGLIFRKLPADLKESLGVYFTTIQRSTKQLYTLIEDFADYTTMSKNETIETEEIDLNYLASSVIENLQESIQKYNGQVLLSDLPTIQSSNSLLFAIFKNLIENGLKYNQSEKPTVNLGYNTTETHHEIIVSDNGIGMSEAYHHRVFEMFKRLHNRGDYEGSGIGLAIVKLCVNKLDGNLRLESEEGEGSIFIIQLPKV
jgi:signal transduction histidine kinase